MDMTQLPAYFQKYLDGKFANLELQIDEVKDVLEGDEGLVNKVKNNTQWRQQFMGKMAIISATMGTILAFAFAIMKDVITNFLKKL